MTRYEQYFAGQLQRWGDKFTGGSLSAKFARYFNSGERIKVRLKHGEEFTGTVGATTGWSPQFLLLRRSNALGSSILLSDEDTVLAVKRGKHYVPLQEETSCP